LVSGSREHVQSLKGRNEEEGRRKRREGEREEKGGYTGGTVGTQ
jgi:hypothetical protein